MNKTKKQEWIDDGFRLKGYRKRYNLTQKDIADKLMVSVSLVQRWESGMEEIPLSHSSKLINWLKMKPFHFYTHRKVSYYG